MQLGADTGSLVTSRSIYGALLHPSQLLRDTFLMPPRRSQKQLFMLQPRDTRCRSSAGSSMTSTRCCRSCRRPRTTSPRRSTRARGARARGTLLPSRQWGVVVSLLLLDVVLLQCGSMCLSSESIVSRLTSNHNLHVRHDSRPHRHLSALIKRPRQ